MTTYARHNLRRWARDAYLVYAPWCITSLRGVKSPRELFALGQPPKPLSSSDESSLDSDFGC